MPGSPTGACRFSVLWWLDDTRTQRSFNLLLSLLPAFGLWSLHAPSFTHMDWQKSCGTHLMETRFLRLLAHVSPGVHLGASFTESLVGSTWSGQEEGHVASRAKEA